MTTGVASAVAIAASESISDHVAATFLLWLHWRSRGQSAWTRGAEVTRVLDNTPNGDQLDVVRDQASRVRRRHDHGADDRRHGHVVNTDACTMVMRNSPTALTAVSSAPAPAIFS